MSARGRSRAGRAPARGVRTGDFRISDRAIRLWTRGLVITLVIGAVIGIGTTIIGAVRHDDDLTYVGVGVVALFGVITIIPAAWLGGQALVPYGGPLGLLLPVGIVAAVGGWSFGPVWGWAGVALFFASVGCFYGMRRRWRAASSARARGHGSPTRPG